MEFGSLGLGSQSQSASNQSGASSLAATTTLDATSEQAVSPVDSGGAAQNDQQQDLLGRDTGGGNRPSASPDDLQLTSRRTTLNFDSEQNRIFLEVVDTTTDEVIEQIPSDQFVKFVDRALNPGGDSSEESAEESTERTELAV